MEFRNGSWLNEKNAERTLGFLRDQNAELMDQYLNQGQFRSIPVFVIFDQNFNEQGHWIERPALITELSAKLRADLFANDPVLSQYAPTTHPCDRSGPSRTNTCWAVSPSLSHSRQR